MLPSSLALRLPAAIALAMMAAGCSAPTVYPGATLESKSPPAYATSDSFATVYTWYKHHLPPGSELSHVTAPAEAAIFFSGRGNRGRKVMITPASRCCKTLIVVHDANS